MANNNIVRATKAVNEDGFLKIYFTEEEVKAILATITKDEREARLKKISDAWDNILKVVEETSLGSVDTEYEDIIVDGVGYNKWVEFWEEPNVIVRVLPDGTQEMSDEDEDLLEAYESWKEMQPSWPRKRVSELSKALGERLAKQIGGTFVVDRDAKGREFMQIIKDEKKLEWRFGRRPEFGQDNILYAEDYFGDKTPEIALAQALNQYSQAFWVKSATWDTLKNTYSGDTSLRVRFMTDVDEYLNIRFNCVTFLPPDEEEGKENMRAKLMNDPRFSESVVDKDSVDEMLTKMINITKGWCRNVDRASGVDVDESYEDEATGTFKYERGDMLEYFYANIKYATGFQFFGDILENLLDQKYEKRDGTKGTYSQWSLAVNVYHAFRKPRLLSRDICIDLLRLGGTKIDGAKRLDWAIKKACENRNK